MKAWFRRWMWGLFYVALIPIFAGLYVGPLPAGSFYDQNIRHEKGLGEQAHQLSRSLTKVIRSHIRQRAWSIGGSKVELHKGTVGVAEVTQTPEGEFLLEITGDFSRPGVKPTSWTLFSARVEVQADRPRKVGPNEARLYEFPVSSANPAILGSAKSPQLPQNPPVSLLFHKPGSSQGAPPTSGGVLVLHPQLEEDLVGFHEAENGDPAAGSDSFLRMAYFSATTVTTLGLGDITPMSGVARLFVGAETVLGLIFIGLFLDRLTRRRKAEGSEARCGGQERTA
jgi:hypothetical protein